MKLLKHIIRKSILLFLAAALVTVPVFAQQAVKENAPEMQVKYLAGDNDALLFNLKYENTSGSNFKLMVLNETGDVLFQNNYSGKKFKKRLKLARLTDTDGVTFLIKPARENIQLSYKVKVRKKVMDDLANTNMD